jgi:protein-disulfide isomerase
MSLLRRCGTDTKGAPAGVADTLLFAFRHFPLAEVHPYATHAAEAAEAAGTQGKFWQMHDYLFQHQGRVEDSDLVEAAAAIGCDVERFVREVAEHRYAPRVCEDFLSGIQSGVNGTPSLFINRMRYDGARDLDSLLGGDRTTGGLESALRRATSAVRVTESEQ